MSVSNCPCPNLTSCLCTDMLTKYEVSRIIGLRAAQLSMGAQPLVRILAPKECDYIYVAALELKERKLPVLIRRSLTGGFHIDVHAADEDLPDDLDVLLETLLM